MRPGLIVEAELAGKRPVAPRLHIGQRDRVTYYVPGIGKETVLTFDGRPIRQEIPGANTQCVAGSRVRVQLRLKTVSQCTAGIEITYGPVGIVHESLIGNRFKI